MPEVSMGRGERNGEEEGRRGEGEKCTYEMSASRDTAFWTNKMKEEQPNKRRVQRDIEPQV